MWYSIYVLDRLLSFQLGLPPAIHDYDCHVPLPSRTGDFDIDWDGTHLATAEEDSSSTIDYFLAVIAFSGIVDHTLRDLYGPKRNQRTTDDLVSTKDLDQRLVNWKLELPGRPRIDLGHAFEKSFIFKRQVETLFSFSPFLRSIAHQ